MKAIQNIGIIPYSLFGGYRKSEWSTFLRAESLVSKTPDMELWEHGKDYGGLIFQRVYWKEMMEIYSGPKILDVSAMDWIDGSYDIIEIGNLADGIACATEPLTKLMKSFFFEKPVVYIPDRLNPALFPRARAKHTGPAKRAIWFGPVDEVNDALESMSDVVKEHNLQLTVLTDQSCEENDLISYLGASIVIYDPETAYEFIKNVDMAIMPPSRKRVFQFRSDGASKICRMLGLPIAYKPADVRRLMTEDQRNEEYLIHTRMTDDLDISASITAYKEMFNLILSVH